MGKKHGFRGTPVRPSPIPSNIGGIFERRGDPMVSPREGREKYGRNLETENPDMDRYFAEDAARARQAQILKPSQVQRGNAFAKFNTKQKHDPQRSAANIVLKMNAELKKAEEGWHPKIRTAKNDKETGGLPDPIPAIAPPGFKGPSRDKQTPGELGHKRGFIDFEGKPLPKEIKRHGKIYRRK